MSPLLSEIQFLRGELQQANESQQQASKEHQRHFSQSSERENALLQCQQQTQQELVETRQTLMSLCSELAESVSASAAPACRGYSSRSYRSWGLPSLKLMFPR